mmetsp:Transcript_29748/g.64365  ORF Transcript_29748/g.64365 Transcript_29748/m.64365 type:complete len:304 (-) Transcript_29748:79-990(-)|eukprot:CAMPEP_0206463758 /NCGR_PEP_ID=MMETSP0324_2-20121206/26795_1 /ASSEMBLY_ACC=CAM_ASM_000836 /TAXON_ID=2866 /ORGANISM="Crypthecodinium cohnii, Strain Seligo" /LENGTH=303 /DNA_ID=CAMNT_0053936227 /DNA_START=46 /DNA_END=957 /DNA_ORIENTATION=+
MADEAQDMEISDDQKNDILLQFLSMSEDQVDPGVAQNLLESLNWNLQLAAELSFGGGGATRPTTAEIPPDIPTDMSMDDFDMHHPGQGHGHGQGPLVPHDLHPGLIDPEDGDLQFALAGRDVSEEDLLQQALQASQQEADQRQRQSLRQEQEAELQESILMDQMREQQRREEERQQAAAQEASEAARAEEERLKAEEEARKAAELEAKKNALPAEPDASEPGRLALMIRMPGGQRLQRAFRKTESVGVIYDYVDLTAHDSLGGQKYRLVSTLPRKVFEAREETLEAAGIQNQFVLMVELIAGA